MNLRPKDKSDIITATRITETMSPEHLQQQCASMSNACVKAIIWSQSTVNVPVTGIGGDFLSCADSGNT